MMGTAPVSIIAGLGPGLGTSTAQALLSAGHTVIGLSRTGKAINLPAEQAPRFHQAICDLTDASAVALAFEKIRVDHGPATNLIYRAHQLHIGGFADTDAQTFESVWRVNALGAFLSAQAVIPQTREQGGGSIIFAGATASIRGGARFAAFASSKFALRGLAQSLAREHGPLGVHVAHIVIDGLIWGNVARDRRGADEARCLSPDAVASEIISLIRQKRSAWTHEVDLRPSSEPF